MKAVVTGATGFLGKWLIEELLKQDYKVLAIVRDISKCPLAWGTSENVEVAQYALTDFHKLVSDETFVEQADIFFHLAWAGTSGMDRADIDMQLDNVRASCDAVCLAKKMGCRRFIHAGSIMEYETIKSFSTDRFVSGMGSIYSIAKTTSDYMARTVAVREEIEYINIIISNIYGVGERSARFINTMLRKMLAGEALALTEGTQKYDFIYASDAVKAIILVAERGNNLENYYIGNSKQRLLREFVLSMHETVRSTSELHFGEVKMGSVLLNYDEFDTYKLEHDLGFKSEITFEQGITLLSEWIRAEENDE